MKKFILQSVILSLALLFFTGCSVDTVESNEQLDQQELNLQMSTQKKINCGLNPEYQEGYSLHSIYIEYFDYASIREKQLVKQKYCANIITITQCTSNPNAEIWVMRGNCRYPRFCKPDVVKPTDPNLKQSSFSTNCF